MDFSEREKKIFFDVISELTGHTDRVGTIEVGLTRRHIIKRVGEKITVKRATELFNEFTETDNKYLDDEKEDTYRISAAGRVLYFDHLITESVKTDLDKDSVKSTIKTGRFTRINMFITGGIAVVSLLFIYLNWKGNNRKEVRELSQQVKELQLKLIEAERNRQTPSPNPIQIVFPDSLRIKVEKD